MAIEFLVGGSAVLIVLFVVVQMAFLWAGQGAVETAVHFAARRFALGARADLARAKAEALAEAVLCCRNRPGGRGATAALTALDFDRDGRGGTSSSPARTGDAYRVRLTHWVELAVPWIDRILFEVAPVGKARFGSRYYLALRADRWVTVE